ncbi:hypothetical protein CA830_04125 [Burkholderia multivorans]|nr:hypothetical protein CA830_04125 [Burkholderia multivorans]
MRAHEIRLRFSVGQQSCDPRRDERPNGRQLRPAHRCAGGDGRSAGSEDLPETARHSRIPAKRRSQPLYRRKSGRQHVVVHRAAHLQCGGLSSQCFESLLAAAPPCTEFLAVNDGSPDNSAEVVQTWAARYPSIRLINKPNGGCASARSAGLHQATGEYITFIDPDDWLFPDSLARLCRAAVLGSTDIVQGGFAKYYESSSHSELINEDWIARDFHRLVLDQGNIRRLLTLQPTIWRRVYRRVFLLENGLDFYHHIRRFDDLPFQFEALSLCRSFKAIPDFIYNYRLQRPGQDVAVNDDRLYVHFDIFALLDSFVRRLGAQQVIAQLLRVKLNTHGWALGQIRDEFKQKYQELALADIEATRQMLDETEFSKVISERDDHGALVTPKKGLFASFKRKQQPVVTPAPRKTEAKSPPLDDEVAVS